MAVHLVGAGPGDPGLLTRRGAELLATADLVVHDRLVDEAVLALVRPGARLVDVGKRAGSPSDPAALQRQINELLAEEGCRGTVVRLKGGDPFLYGRGAEEALALERAGVAYEVVPGVPSAVAVPAAAGVPVTHRGLSSSVSVLSGHDLEGDGAWMAELERFAATGGTLVVLMAAATHRRLAEILLGAGCRPDTPALVVERGTTPEQKSRRCSLAELAGDESGLLVTARPALLVVGEVARLRLRGYEDRPLSGWRVAVTRASHQSGPLSAALARAGARPLEVPVIELRPPADGGVALAGAARRAASFEWVVLSSANGVAAFFAELRDARALGTSRVAAIGPATAAALASRGVVADLVPTRFLAEGLLECFPVAPPGTRPPVLLARAAVARDVLPEGLRRLGYDVEVVEAYRTVAATPDAARIAQLASCHAVTFTSPSSVEAFLGLAGRDLVPEVVASIGPVTSAAARENGLEVSLEAPSSTVPGLVEALSAFALERRHR